MHCNKTKGRVDTFDQIYSNNSCSKMTKRWPMAIFYGMVNAAGVNTSILYHSHVVNQGKKTQTRRRFMKELALEMIRPCAERRIAQPKFLLGVREAVKMTFPQIAIVSILPGPEQLPKHKRCRICPYSRDRKTIRICTKCHQPVCKDHAILVRICTDCNSAGKTSCKLLFTTWNLCTFIYVNCKQSCLVC